MDRTIANAISFGFEYTPPITPSKRGTEWPFTTAAKEITATDADWRNIILLSLPSVVTRRKVKTQTIHTLEKSSVLKKAPPLHTGERMAEANKSRIINTR
jgi:hypothetical protein